jgi:hypothetical protein
MVSSSRVNRLPPPLPKPKLRAVRKKIRERVTEKEIKEIRHWLNVYFT